VCRRNCPYKQFAVQGVQHVSLLVMFCTQARMLRALPSSSAWSRSLSWWRNRGRSPGTGQLDCRMCTCLSVVKRHSALQQGRAHSFSYTLARTRIYTHAHTRTWIHRCVRIYMHKYTYTNNTYIHASAHIHQHTYARNQVFPAFRDRTSSRTHTHTHTHTHHANPWRKYRTSSKAQ
jgi:hypothetical protein